MAVVAPLIAQAATPENIERAAKEAKSLTEKIAHSASLTETEEYLGWVPLLLLLYKFWLNFLGPQVAFTIQTQIGIARTLNTFGAGIDTKQMEKVLASVDKTMGVTPTTPPSLGTAIGTAGNPIPPLYNVNW